MSKVKIFQTLSILVMVLVLNSCTKDAKVEDYGFIVKGVSGNKVMLDRTWYQDCISDGNGGWMKSMRTLSGNELSTTITTYQNGSSTPDCTNGAAMITTFVQTLTNDNKLIPITWTDAQGNPSNAPSGLENIKEGNGATGVVTFATITPLTATQATNLNSVSYLGYSDWSSGITKDVLAVFNSIGPAKGTIVVDDRTNIGAVYDGISIDPKQYPTLMPNNAPHKGQLNGIKIK